MKTRNKDKDYLNISVKKTDFGYSVIFYVSIYPQDGLYKMITKDVGMTKVLNELCSVFNLKREEIKIKNIRRKIIDDLSV